MMQGGALTWSEAADRRGLRLCREIRNGGACKLGNTVGTLVLYSTLYTCR